MQIAKNAVVSIEYRLTDSRDILIDQSSAGHPLAFIFGNGSIIPGLEKALLGHKTGDKLKAVIAPAEAYGERNESLSQRLPKEMFGGVDELQPGMQFEAETDAGVEVITLVAVEDEHVVVDGNHPLAGVELHFDVTIVEVRAATADEIAHGHVHGPGGHHH